MDAKSIIAQLRQSEQQYDRIRPAGTTLLWAADYISPNGTLTQYEVYTYSDSPHERAWCCRAGWRGLLRHSYPRGPIIDEMKNAGIWEDHYL